MKSKIISIVLTLILLISNLSIIYAQGNSSIGFSDIEEHWAKDTVLWGVERGIVTGYPNGTFQPNKKVSEAEFLTMLIRAYKPDITVSSKGHWANNYYAFALDMDYPAVGLYDPLKADKRSSLGDPERLKWREYSISRVKVAELISATQGVWYDRDDAIQYLLGYGLAKGKDPSKMTIRSYDGKAELTRAEAVQFIKNLLEKGNKEIAARASYPSDVSLLPPIDLEPDFPFTEAQVWLDQIDDVVDGEFRFKLWNEKTKRYEPTNYRLDETLIPDLNKRVFNAVKAIVDAGGFANIYYNSLEDGNGLVVIRYYPSHTAYLFGNYDIEFLIYEKPYKDTEKNLITNMEIDLLHLYNDARTEAPYNQEYHDVFKATFLSILNDEQVFNFILNKYASRFNSEFKQHSNDQKTINKHKVYAHRLDDSHTYYNIQFAE